METEKIIKICGLSIYYMEVDHITGSENDFTYEKKTQEEYKIFILMDNLKYELYLFESEIICPSGWSVCTYGKHKLTKVDDFKNIQYLPIIKNNHVAINFSDNYFDCDYFKWYYNGGCDWYSDGFVQVNKFMFKSKDSCAKKN